MHTSPFEQSDPDPGDAPDTEWIQIATSILELALKITDDLPSVRAPAGWRQGRKSCQIILDGISDHATANSSWCEVRKSSQTQAKRAQRAVKRSKLPSEFGSGIIWQAITADTIGDAIHYRQSEAVNLRIMRRTDKSHQWPKRERPSTRQLRQAMLWLETSRSHWAGKVSDLSVSEVADRLLLMIDHEEGRG